jgi:mannan endo-1,4-beta-mannosidase
MFINRTIAYNIIVVELFMICWGPAVAQKKFPSDTRATKETTDLFQNLFRVAGQGFMFGHQDALAYGVEWRYQKDRSDVKDVTGDYPAVYGWDLGGIERTNSKVNLDEVPFEKMKEFIREAYLRGGVNTISWHADSPWGNGKNAWDTTKGTVASILPGGINHERYKSWLNKLADFFGSLRGSRGEAIPVLFRPFHELTGHWFWWCRNTCSPSEFKNLWRFTADYLRKEKNVHQLLFVYNTSGDFSNKQEFLERYPGDDMVDMLSFDTYQYDDPKTSDAFIKSTNKRLKIVQEAAGEKNKLMALAETGFEAVPYPEWWTGTLLKAIGDTKISYVLVWRNHGLAAWNNKMHYYAPYKGQVSAADFVKFYELQQTFFEKEAAAKKLYQSVE